MQGSQELAEAATAVAPKDVVIEEFNLMLKKPGDPVPEGTMSFTLCQAIYISHTFITNSHRLPG